MCLPLAVAIAIAATRLDSGRAPLLSFTIMFMTLAFVVGWCHSALSASLLLPEPIQSLSIACPQPPVQLGRHVSWVRE